MQLHKTALGLTFGIMWGLTVMVGTWWLLYMCSPGGTISKLGVFYYGYSYSFFGGIIGFVWGFIDGFICGFVFAWLYNLLSKPKSTKADSSQ
jgi:Na+/proline symporter